MPYDFSGWATRNDLLCADGRIIRKDAFQEDNGKTVSLVWNHQHDDSKDVLGHAVLENRDEGVYAYCTFNDTESGKNAKTLVQHGDIRCLSIYANKLKQVNKDVIHGTIRELSLVLAGANPGASIDFVMAHGDEGEDALIANYDESALVMYHSADPKKEEKKEMAEEQKEAPKETSEKKDDTGSDKTVQDIIDSMNEEQKLVMYKLVESALESQTTTDEGEEKMKHNVFDNDINDEEVLSHAAQSQIISMAKSSSVGSLQAAISQYSDDNVLSHGVDDIESLFPDYKDVRPGAPEMITNDQGWISSVMNGVHKSPISRIRTRQADVTGADLRAFGYQKGKKKGVPGNIKLLKRTTDPQTVYRKDALNRDDIIDITDFSVVDYQYQVMKMNLNEEIATAIMIGDGRDEGDDNKIFEEHIRSIWHDDELYTIHVDVDINAAKKELQGTGTAVSFGDNYIYAEAIITAALYSREKYKGSGNLAFYCTPHLLNVMLLARDMNGRRIYDSKSDLAAALNVSSIQTVEQFEGKTRTTSDSKTKKLLGMFVNLSDYQVGSTKGGEITKFNQFDIDFNQEKYLIETRLSGALTRIKSAICLEEDVVSTPVEDDEVAG